MTSPAPPSAGGSSRLLVLDEDQRSLVESAREFLAAEAPVARFRALRDKGEVLDTDLWAELVELGWAGLLVPEDQGGLGLGLPEAVSFMELLGQHLCAVPMVSALMVGPLAPELGVATGRRVSLAWQEGPRQLDCTLVHTRFREGRVYGEKALVLDGSRAEEFVVSAVDEHGQLVLVAVSAADATVVPLQRTDHRDASNVRMDGAAGRKLSAGASELQAAIDRGTIALSAELLGITSAALDLTLDYLRTREQFGRPLGAFQALQHRAVDAFIATELARSAVLAAAFEPSPAHTCLAKAQASTAAELVVEEGVQMHGGIGMTDEHDMGLYLKRAFVLSATHGSASWHRQRWASLHGY